MSQSFQWKSQGGINRRPVANVVRSSNTFGTVLNAQTLGQKYTTMVTESDVRADETSAIYNFDDNEINFNNVICYYPFNNTSEIDDISNQSLANNLPTPKPFTLKANNLSAQSSINYVYNDLISQNVLQLNPNSKVLATDSSFNTLNAFGNLSTSAISTALTFSCFVYINKSDVSTTPGQSKQFCLFALDDLNQNALQYLSQGPPISDSSSNLLYLWYPNINGNAQLLYNYKSDNLGQSDSYINIESTKQIPTEKWTQVVLVMAGLSIYLMIDGEIYIQSANSDVQVASFIPDQPININLGGYTVTPDPVAPPVLTATNTTNTATPLLSDCKVANWAVGQELASAVANPQEYGHQYNINSVPNKEGLLYYLLSKEVCSFSAPTVFRSALNIGGDLQSYGTNNFYGNATFFTNTHFADGITVDGSFNQITYDQTGNVFIDSSTFNSSQKNASLLINNQAKPVNPSYDHMASMLVFTSATPNFDTQPKSSLPSYVNELQFSISGENVSVGHGFGDSSFNVFGNSVMDGSLSLINSGALNVTGPIEANGGINTTVINSNIINVFDKLDVSGINFTNGYIGISQDTTTGPIRIGNGAGQTSQDANSVAIGNGAGQTSQDANSVAIGNGAGQTSQDIYSVAIGNGAGQTSQDEQCVAIGNAAGNQNQSLSSVAIGNNAGYTSQGQNSVAIGYLAGQTSLGVNSVAIGPNTVCTDASSVALGSGATTTASNQIVLGTATETVKIPGQLDVSGNLTVNNPTSNSALINVIGPGNANTYVMYGLDTFSTSNFTPPRSGPAVQIRATDTGGYAANLSFWTAENGDPLVDATQRMTITTSGNVGIGTDTPITTLEVIGDISANSFIGNVNGNAATATALKTARTIGGVSFDGTANIDLPGVNIAGNQNTIGNAATATALQTARTIGGVSFDGTANINLPGVNIAGNQNTIGNAATATALQTARTIGGVSFDGTANINLPGVNTAGNQNTTGNAATVTNGVYLNTSNDFTITPTAPTSSNNSGTELATLDWVKSHSADGGAGWDVNSNTSKITSLNSYQVFMGSGMTATEVTVSVNGITESTSFNSTSDVRLKENITNLDNSLDKICNIRGVNYNWKNDETKTKTAGVIAQEVLEQIPEAVNDNDSEKLSVNYNSIIAHLIESVKELKREIDELKAK